MSDRKLARKVRSGIRTLPEGLLMLLRARVGSMSDSQNQGALRDAGKIIERFGGIRPML